MDVFANALWSGDDTLSSTEVQTPSLSMGLFSPITGAASALSSSPTFPKCASNHRSLEELFKMQILVP